MRKIDRKKPPACLDQVKPNHDWDQFKQSNRDCYSSIKQSLLEEQFFLCCYCESKIDLLDCHVEHLKPKSKNQELHCDYSNLACSCQEPHSCGHKKANWDWQDDEFRSPHDEEIGKLFCFSLDGVIEPTEHNPLIAKKMIEKLNLNHDSLRSRRERMAKEIITTLGPEPTDEIRNILQVIYTEIQPDNRLPEFHSLCSQYLHLKPSAPA
ncbi:MAG: TIGR02646 family protein [Candidatus Pacebacteria bacterium]|nr:TIGR02646 family protein [Candidatus Paceibacterota bacterium]